MRCDRERGAGDEQRDGERFELHERRHAGRDRGDSRTEVRHDDATGPAATAHAPAFSSPIQRNAIQLSSATSRLVVSSISMYF